MQALVLGLLDDRLDQGVASPVARPSAGSSRWPTAGHRLAAVGASGTSTDLDLGHRRRVARRAPTMPSWSARAWSSLVITTARGIPTSAHSRHRPPGRARRSRRWRRSRTARVRGPQPGPHLTGEVGVPGSVHQVDLGARVHERRDRERHGPPVGLLGLLEVADRGALRDRPGAVDRPETSSSASRSEVLPDPLGPTRTTLRIRSGAGASRSCWVGLRPCLSDMSQRKRSRPLCTRPSRSPA